MRVYGLAWVGLLAIAVANGVVREATYGPGMRALASEWTSTLIAMAALGAFIWWVMRRWPARHARHAVKIGAAWVLMTVAFEFAFGRARGRAWGELGAMYEVWNGRPWVLLLAWVGGLPWVMRRTSEAGRHGQKTT
ncbi:MAG: hypothetical protein H6811_09735 [Phycisphaeraceae bacterium]|nr:hypothetical protein [Phycisphaeraceae bacterium]